MCKVFFETVSRNVFASTIIQSDPKEGSQHSEANSPLIFKARFSQERDRFALNPAKRGTVQGSARKDNPTRKLEI